MARCRQPLPALRCGKGDETCHHIVDTTSSRTVRMRLSGLAVREASVEATALRQLCDGFATTDDRFAVGWLRRQWWRYAITARLGKTKAYQPRWVCDVFATACASPLRVTEVRGLGDTMQRVCDDCTLFGCLCASLWQASECTVWRQHTAGMRRT